MNHLRAVHDGDWIVEDDLVPLRGEQPRSELMGASGDGFPRISEKLTWIIETIPSAEGRRLTPERLARQIFEQSNGEYEVTASHLQNLKSGFRDNPSARLLLEISRAAGLPAAYFWSDVAENLVREAVERAISDHGRAAPGYDALVDDPTGEVDDKEVIASLRRILSALLADSSLKNDPAP